MERYRAVEGELLIIFFYMSRYSLLPTTTLLATIISLLPRTVNSIRPLHDPHSKIVDSLESSRRSSLTDTSSSSDNDE